MAREKGRWILKAVSDSKVSYLKSVDYISGGRGGFKFEFTENIGEALRYWHPKRALEDCDFFNARGGSKYARMKKVLPDDMTFEMVTLPEEAAV